MKNDQEILQLKNITKIYTSRSQEYTAVKNIDFIANKGRMIFVFGPSGSGKTTLLTIMAGFLKPTVGEVSLFGKNINYYSLRELQSIRAQKIGFVFQTFLLIESLTVYENIALVNNFLPNKSTGIRKQILMAMESVGISHLSKKRPFELSHGERQRVAIARALINSTELIIADEPTASIEAEQAENIIRLLENCKRIYNTCVIVASHDLRLRSFADKSYILESGTLIAE
jgi:ABC-type lipoprotein export system ATPase subunit